MQIFIKKKIYGCSRKTGLIVTDGAFSYIIIIHN